MKRAIIYLPYLAPYRLDVLNALAKEYNLLVLFAFNNAREHNFDYDSIKDRIEFKFKVLRTFSIGIRPIHLGLFREFFAWKPDIVFSNEYGFFTLMTGVIYRRLFNFKHVLTTSDNVDIFLNSNKFRRLMRDISIRSACGIVVYTPYVADVYRSSYPFLKVTICPNIQDVDSTVINADVLTSEKSKVNFCYVGRLELIKGLDILIEALNELNFKDWCLNIAGYGSQEESLRKQVNLLGLNNKINFHGKLSGENLKKFYQVNDILVLPSRYEPFGAVVNEALCLGLPSVVSDVSGAKMYINEGMNGYIFESENIHHLRSCLEKCIHGLSELKSNKLWNHSVNHYIGAYSMDNF